MGGHGYWDKNITNTDLWELTAQRGRQTINKAEANASQDFKGAVSENSKVRAIYSD